MHSVWFKRSLLLSLVAVFTTVACMGGSTPSPGSVKVMAKWTGDEQASFLAVMKPFTDQTGIKITYEASTDQDVQLTERVAAGHPPDLAVAPSPILLASFAKQGKIVALNNIVDMTRLKAENAPGWIDLGMPAGDGKLYQVYSWVSLPWVIWYNPKNFYPKNYNIPSTWAALLDLQASMKQGGTTPWCISLQSDAAYGWPGSDWVKEIVLSQAGPTVYDNWSQGKVRWGSTEIKQAWQTWGTMLGPNAANVYGGAGTMRSVSLKDAGTPMFQNPPKCYMHNQGSSAASLFQSAAPSLQAGADYHFFPLPAISPQYAGARVVGGDAWSMFHDTPQARQMIKYLTTPAAQEIWVKRGGKFSPNSKVSLDSYPNGLSRSMASILVNTKIVKNVAGDLMPADMKNAYQAAVLKFADNQSQLDKILADLDKVQAKAYTQ